MNTSKVAVVFNTVLGKIFSVVGYATGAFFLLVLFVAVFDGSMQASTKTTGIIVFMVIIAAAILLIIQGSKIKKRIKRFKTYVGLISIENIKSLENIAASLSQSVDFVRYDLQKMIDKQFFVNAYIDRKSNEIVIGSPRDMSSQASPSIQTTKQNFAVETEQIRCSGCGATNAKQKGIVSSCEYCGSQLK